MRVLGVVRLSADKDGSTSVAGQREYIQQWADANGHTVIDFAEDIDISGATDPFKRPQLGQWLNRVNEWDILVAYRADRIARNVRNLQKLVAWCEDHQRLIVSTSEPFFDMTSPFAPLMIALVGMMAQWELEAITTRVLGSHARLRALERWGAGPAPFGFKTAPKAGGGVTLIEHDENADIARELVQRYLGGESFAELARWLNDAEIKTMTGTPWSTTTVRKVLSNTMLLGYKNTKDGRVQYGPALIPTEDFQRVAGKLAAPHPNQVPHEASPLAGLIRCDHDKVARFQKQQGGKYKYYRTLCGCSIKADIAEATVEQLLGGLQVHRRQWIPASDNSTKVKELEDHLEWLYSQPGHGRAGDIRQRQIDKVVQQLDEIGAIVIQAGRYEMIPTGQTWSEAWSDDSATRRRMITESGIRFWLRPNGTLGIDLETSNMP